MLAIGQYEPSLFLGMPLDFLAQILEERAALNTLDCHTLSLAVGNSPYHEIHEGLLVAQYQGMPDQSCCHCVKQRMCSFAHRC